MRLERTYNIYYWLWLSLCCSPGSNSGDILLGAFNYNPKAVFDASREDYAAIGKLTENTIERLCNKDMAEPRNIKIWCDKNNIGILAPDSPLYPERLFDIPKRPLVLYYKGALPDLENNVFIACVGTRRMTEYGKRQAYTISYDLARAGVVVVSGAAKGVDAICHRGALDAGGHTVAVLGCGIDRVYPVENIPLYREISQKGTLISEFKPGTPPEGMNFPVRNRLISGLSQGTVVIEADNRSGAMITASCAEEQGRSLFALPGKVGETNSIGTNKLIKNGAKAITEAHDILEEFEFLYPHRIFPEKLPEFRPKFVDSASDGIKVAAFAKGTRRKANAPKPESAECDETAKAQIETETLPQKCAPSGISDQAKDVWEALSKSDSPLCADDIAARCDIPIGKIMTCLTLLEIKGAVAAIPGGRYLLK